MRTMEEISRFVGGVHGWLTRDEGALLYTLARACPAGSAIVEIGSYKGKSTVWLAAGAAAGTRCRVHAIDPHMGSVADKRRGERRWTFDGFMQNIAAAGVAEFVIPVVATSEEAFKTFAEPIGLLFIDGEHEYAFVKRDCEQWSTKLIAGGVICFHDTMASAVNPFTDSFNAGWQGPRRVFQEAVLASPDYSGFGHVGSISYAVKRAPRPDERAREAARYLATSRTRRAILALVEAVRTIGRLT